MTRPNYPIFPAPAAVHLTTTAKNIGLLGAISACLLLTSCATTPAATDAGNATPVAASASSNNAGAEELSLHEGDIVKVSFPGVPTMDTTQTVRPDGRVSLPMLGEIVVAGKTTDSLTKELREAYGPKLVSKEVMVTLVSSPFPVYVTGSVLRPGKILTDHPISAFDALMEAGGFDRVKADLRAVVVIRNEGGQTRRFSLNLQDVLDGKPVPPFPLKRGDSVYVPEKFTWF